MRTRIAAILAAALLAGGCASADTGSSSGEAAPGPGATSQEGATADEPVDAGDAAGDGDGETGDDADGAGTTDDGEATSPGSGSEPATGAGGGSTEPAPAESAPASAAPGPEAPGDGTRTIDPIPAGTYEYDTTGTRQLGDNPEEQLPPVTSLEVTPADGDDVQVQVRDLRDEDGYGSRNTLLLRYGVEGAVLLASTIESTVDIFGSPFTQTSELEADPPTTIAPLDAGVGFSTEFRLVGDNITVEATLDVVRQEAVAVGGASVDAFVVEVHYDLSGEVEGTSDATWWIRPDDLLNLREESRTEVESRGLQFREEYRASLRSLDPS